MSFGSLKLLLIDEEVVGADCLDVEIREHIRPQVGSLTFNSYTLGSFYAVASSPILKCTASLLLGRRETDPSPPPLCAIGASLTSHPHLTHASPTPPTPHAIPNPHH